MSSEHHSSEHSTSVTDVNVLIVGSGFGGISASVNLLKRNMHDFVILERRKFVGGTWAQNRYPGAAVDVQSPLYSLSFAPWDWSQMFAKRDELEQYTLSVYQQYNLHAHTRTSANVTSLRWCQQRSRWQVEVDNQLAYTAKFVINASGPLSKPVMPDFPGDEEYKGRRFHTNQWPQDFELANQRVGIIGSGATSVQVVPAIAEKVKSLHVFQRSAHWVLPRADRVFSSWQRKIMRTRVGYKLIRRLIYWGLEMRILAFKYSDTLLSILGAAPAKKHLKTHIVDPQLRAKLTPDYTIGCKRILVSNDFYPTLCQPHVHLHDKSQGIKQFTEHGVVTADGQQIELDAVIYATGFDATDQVISYPVEGKDGKLLASFWEDFPRAYLGTSIPDFPNLFIVTGPNTGIGHTSAIFMIEAQMDYIMGALDYVKQRKAKQIEVRRQAEQNYTEMIHQHMAKTVWHTGGCNSWYKSKTGKVVAMFPGFSFMYKYLCRRFKPGHHLIE